MTKDRAVSIAACLAAAALAAGWFFDERSELEAPNAPFVQREAPNSEAVETIIEFLRYSGYQDFTRPEVQLEMNFPDRTWLLRNLHRFDANGNVLLMEGRYGICEDLVAYVYQKIKPFFPDDRFRIDFVEVVESSYFQSETGGHHVVLRIADLLSAKTGAGFQKVYILDPALRRYGSPEMFDDYIILGGAPVQAFMKARQTDNSFGLNQGPPIVINRLGYVTFFVRDMLGRFDRDNFEIVLSVTRRYRFARKPLFIIRRQEGRTTFEEPDYKIERVMGRVAYKKLKETVTRLYRDLEKKL